VSAARSLARAEWLLLTAALSLLVLFRPQEVHWARFLVAFAAIDLVGYLPGALAFRAGGGRPIHAAYHWLYNATHNFVTGAALVSVWALLTGRLEWAMLAIPIHLAGDRGVFGNGFKPAGQPFERTALPRGMTT
jgi:hypothetical protein